jgi:hypothetical protein
MGVINYYMNEIIESLISDIHKYFMNSSAFIRGINSLNSKNIDQIVMKTLEIDSNKITSMLQKYRERFNKEVTVFKNLTQ